MSVNRASCFYMLSPTQLLSPVRYVSRGVSADAFGQSPSAAPAQVWAARRPAAVLLRPQHQLHAARRVACQQPRRVPPALLLYLRADVYRQCVDELHLLLPAHLLATPAHPRVLCAHYLSVGLLPPVVNGKS